ncbi:MAG: hypothetical protein ACRBCS_10840 [Cellvibrionaceae bacterium]
MSTKFLVSEVVPHKKTMSLLTEIVEHDEESLKARVIINNDTLFLTDEKIPAYIGIEYMAQSIAAFAGVQERLKGGEAKVGFLVGTRKYNTSVSHFVNHSTLIIDVAREFQADNGLGVFNCSISSNLDELVNCVLNVFQPDSVEEFLASEQMNK